MFAETRLRSGSSYGTVTVLRSVSSLTFDDKYNDIGAISLTLPLLDANTLGVGANSVIEILPDGQTYPNMWFGLEAVTSTQTSDSGLTTTFGGKSIANWLSDGLVFPSTWFSPLTNPEKFATPVVQGTSTIWTPLSPVGVGTSVVQGHAFENATPGNILRTLIDRAQQRGALLWIDDTNFTGTTTSSGAAWASTLTFTYNNGTTILAVLQDLVARRMLDFRMSGNQLQVYNYGFLATHYTADQITLRRGKNLTEQTRNVDASVATSDLLVQGDETVLKFITDSAATTNIGRKRESFVTQSGITDGPTLQTLGLAQIAFSGHVQTEDTLGIADNDIKPWTNFKAGDWVWVDFDGTPKNIQLQQIAAAQQDGNNLLVGLTLGDLIKDADQKLQQTIANMTGGADARGGLPNQSDFKGPADPSSVVASPTAYRDANGIDNDLVVVTWAAPTTNVDGTTLTDLDRFEVQYKLGSSTTWSSVAAIPASAIPLAAYISNLPPGQSFVCQVRAVDSQGNASNWVAQSNTVSALPKFTTAPPTPSTPIIVSGIQSLRIEWDGLTSTGGSYDAAWLRTDVYLSTLSGFTPSASTKIGSFNTQTSTLTITGLSSVNTYFVKLIAVDKSGNSSAVSTQSAGGSASQVGSSDIAANSVTALMIQNAVITGAKLVDGTVTGTKIAAGTISTNNLTVSAFGPSVAPNGSFEELTTLPASDTAGAAGWKVIQYPGSVTVATAAVDVNNTTQSTGSNMMKLSLPAGNQHAGFFGLTTPTPTTQGDVWYCSLRIRGDAITAPTAVNVVAILGDTKAEASSFSHGLNGANVSFATVETDPTKMNGAAAGTVNLSGSASAYTYWEVAVTVPNNASGNQYKYMTLAIGETLGNHVTHSINVDAVTLQKVGGSATITNLTASKITAGTLNADIVLGARIKTSDVGPRVEISTNGILAFDGVNDTPTVNISSTDGSVTFAGTLTAGAVSSTSVGDSQILNSFIQGSDFVADANGGQVLLYEPAGQTILPLTTPGASSWLAPTSVTYPTGTSYTVKVECWGAGGGGCGGASLGAFGGYGGSGGEYAREDFVTVVAGSSYAYTIGTGGTGGAATAPNGGAGTATTFTGVDKTVVAHGGAGAIGSYKVAGAAGSTNSIHFSGGANNPAINAGSGGAGGGSSAGTTRSGNPGGAAPGSGAGGAGGAAPTPTDVSGPRSGAGGAGGASTANGVAGGAPGGAGGGGGGAGGGHAGGAGARGQIRITYGGTVSLVASISGVSGTDAYGNSFPVGLSVNGNSVDGAWTAYTPILKSFSSGLTISVSAVIGRYKIIGKTIFVQGELTASALAAQATVSLPVAGTRRFLNCGTMVCVGTSPPTDQAGIARMLDSGANSLVLVGYSGGFRDCASGNGLQWSITYEIP